MADSSLQLSTRIDPLTHKFFFLNQCILSQEKETKNNYNLSVGRIIIMNIYNFVSICCETEIFLILLSHYDRTKLAEQIYAYMSHTYKLA